MQLCSYLGCPFGFGFGAMICPLNISTFHTAFSRAAPEVNTKERARSPKDRQGKGQANSAALHQLFAKICRLETSL